MLRPIPYLAAAAAIALGSLACGTAAEATHASPPHDPAVGGGEPQVEDGGKGGEGGKITATGPAVCPDATGVYDVEPAQSSLLFLVDRSGSMHLKVTGTDTRWILTKAGLFDIFDALPAATNGAVAMFPWGDEPVTCCKITTANVINCSGCGPGELPGPELRCDPEQYHDLPLAMAPMGPMQLELMKAQVSTADHEFYWGTPLAPALQGAVDTLVASAAPGVSSVILLTDGLPTSCDTPDDPDANEIERAVEAAAYGFAAGAVRTYVLGVIDGDKAADAGNLSAIALAGGTARYPGCETAEDCAYRVNVESFAADLNDALSSIALEAISCSFDVPEVEQGAPDYDAVNVTITAGGETITVARDHSHADGWDYLPGFQQIQLYGTPCERLKSDAEAEVQVVVGCQTVGG